MLSVSYFQVFFPLSCQEICGKSLSVFLYTALLISASQLHITTNYVQMNGSAHIKKCKMLKMCKQAYCLCSGAMLKKVLLKLSIHSCRIHEGHVVPKRCSQVVNSDVFETPGCQWCYGCEIRKFAWVVAQKLSTGCFTILNET